MVQVEGSKGGWEQHGGELAVMKGLSVPALFLAGSGGEGARGLRGRYC